MLRVFLVITVQFLSDDYFYQCSDKLKPLVDYVLSLSKMLEKRASGASDSETNGLARRVKTMLVELNEYDEARAVARAFSLKEAL